MLFQRNPNLNAIAEDTDDNMKPDFEIGEERVSNNDSTIEFVSNIINFSLKNHELVI